MIVVAHRVEKLVVCELGDGVRTDDHFIGVREGDNDEVAEVIALKLARGKGAVLLPPESEIVVELKDGALAVR